MFSWCFFRMKCDCTYIFVRFMRIVWPSRILRYLLFFFPALNINRTRFAGTFPAQKTERITHTHTHTHKKKNRAWSYPLFPAFSLDLDDRHRSSDLGALSRWDRPGVTFAFGISVSEDKFSCWVSTFQDRECVLKTKLFGHKFNPTYWHIAPFRCSQRNFLSKHGCLLVCLCQNFHLFEGLLCPLWASEAFLTTFACFFCWQLDVGHPSRQDLQCQEKHD